ncbi:MAG: hypothetical protein SOZ80_08095 [Prevotella sp.]|uniref:helix-turn-helix transcriptional regulator n=1 Tax=Prevotella sp. TaxID=59823 RepID=UPI002A32AB83|nr:hypothetical protein [Prevotella sp.]MDD7317802.1 hypothetical protein [Prevotellaceae bacterium]MDY4020717.1 hypothetical protein [Prevotella sp.]
MTNEVKFSIKRKVNDFFDSRTGNVFQKQQLIVFLAGVFLILTLTPLHFLGIIGANDKVLFSLSVSMIVVSLLTQIFYIKRTWSLDKSLSIFSIGFQIIQALKIVYIAIYGQGVNYLIPLNGFISLMSISVIAMCYIRNALFIMCGICELSLALCVIIRNDPILVDFFFIYTAFIICLSLIGPTMTFNIKRMQRDNADFKQNENMLLNVVKLNRSEIYNYIEMCRNENPTDKDIDRFFDLLSERAKRNLVRTVERKLAMENSDEEKLHRVFPDFTKTELAVAHLIILGHKLSDICQILDKSENNINTVRSHIRKKLNLNIDNDLREALIGKL